MSTLLDVEPILLEGADAATPCGYLGCEEVAAWSALFNCGETMSYCDAHLKWAQRQGSIACDCPDSMGYAIWIVMVVPL
ncbi:hypothetical protein SEA_NAMAGO_4 [Microbacterium phage Namago]|nr:hypothetical protein SEA_NAMAGO_4 [Microbacterium phage Namago]